MLKWDFGGEFGDTFGALNALFSGLATGGVLIAILMQRQELIFQREELKLTRPELNRSAPMVRFSSDVEQGVPDFYCHHRFPVLRRGVEVPVKVAAQIVGHLD